MHAVGTSSPSFGAKPCPRAPALPAATMTQELPSKHWSSSCASTVPASRSPPTLDAKRVYTTHPEDDAHGRKITRAGALPVLPCSDAGGLFCFTRRDRASRMALLAQPRMWRTPHRRSIRYRPTRTRSSRRARRAALLPALPRQDAAAPVAFTRARPGVSFRSLPRTISIGRKTGHRRLPAANDRHGVRNRLHTEGVRYGDCHNMHRSPTRATSKDQFTRGR